MWTMLRASSTAQCASGYCHPAIGICVASPISSTGEVTTDDPTFFVNCYGISGTFHCDPLTYTHRGGPISVSLRGETSGGGTLRPRSSGCTPALTRPARAPTSWA